MVEAIVNISTFRGSCVEATHYYGSLHVISSEFIELKRPITKEEIDKNPDRWYNYDEGDLTNCFKSWLRCHYRSWQESQGDRSGP